MSNSKIMEDLRTIRNKPNESWLKFKLFVKNNKWKIIISLLTIFILIFPQFSASIIAKWVNTFIGTLINTISL